MINMGGPAYPGGHHPYAGGPELNKPAEVSQRVSQ